MPNAVRTCKTQFSNVFNQIIKNQPGEFDKKEIKTTKKAIGLVSELFADKLKSKDAKKIVGKIKKLEIGGIKIKIDTGSGKPRDYTFKGKKFDFEGTEITRVKNDVTVSGKLSTGEQLQHQFSLKTPKK